MIRTVSICYCNISTDLVMTLLRQRVLTSTMIAVWLAITPPLQASDTAALEVQTDSPQTAPGGCSACDARKQHQVKARLEKKKQQEQAGQVDPGQSSQSTETSTVNGSD